MMLKLVPATQSCTSNILFENESDHRLMNISSISFSAMGSSQFSPSRVYVLCNITIIFGDVKNNLINIHDRLAQQLTLTIAKLANVFSMHAAKNTLGVSRLGAKFVQRVMFTRKLCMCGQLVATFLAGKRESGNISVCKYNR